MTIVKIVGTKSNAIFDPLRFFKDIEQDKNAGVVLSKVILGTVAGVVEVPFSLLEHLYRIPAGLFKPDLLVDKVTWGKFDIPNVFKTEDLFSNLENIGLTDDQTTILRQSFVRQYSDKYSLHRLDFNFTPLLNDAYYSWRIMDITIKFYITPAIESTDVFPQTKWEKEGLKVKDKVYLKADGKYTGRANISPSINGFTTGGEGTIEIKQGRDYFYKLEYETQIPTVEGFALSNGFGWRLRGTYEKYIDCGTKRLTAILLVPKHIRQATISGAITCGITNKNRQDPEYPSHRALKYGVSAIGSTPLHLGG
ncbi:MAG: hypothetical protein VKK42_20640 [Lyngbya sp.]|nr:hypothetical protein [Lyngbya sp.]